MTKTAALEHAADRHPRQRDLPGGVSTPMNENEPEGGVVPLTPLGRRAHVSEISGAVAFLARDDASFVTGTELVIDGGYLARVDGELAPIGSGAAARHRGRRRRSHAARTGH